MGITYNPRTVTDGLVLALDAGNTKSFSPNVFPRGTDIYGWYFDNEGNANGNNCTVSRDTISSPVGNTPLKMEVTGNDPYLRSYDATEWNLAAASSGDTWTVSFYVKASQNTTGEVLLFESNGTTYYNIPNTTYNITTSWQRVSFTGTFSNANTTVIQLRLDGPNSGGSGITIWWDGLQLERGSTASEFTKNYTLDSSLNYRTLDLTRNGNNGTLTNMDGGNLNTSNGGSLSFDGSNDHISIPYDASLKPTTAITMEAFCYIQNNGGTWASLIQYPQNSSSHTAPYFDWGIYLNMGSRYLHTRIDGVVPAADSPNNVWNFNEWTYIAITFENQSVKYYVNGNSVGSSSVSKTSIVYDANNPVYIGKNASGTEQFEGRLGNIKLYNKVLTAAEIQQNFNALRGRYGI